MLFVVLCPGTPEGSTGSGSGFKASQKTGQRVVGVSPNLITWVVGIYSFAKFKKMDFTCH